MNPLMMLGLACGLFALQFLFSKCYQLRTGVGLEPVLWLSVLQAAWVIAIFWPLNGFALRCNGTSLLFASAYALCALGCSAMSQFAMGRGTVAMVTLFCLAGGLVLPTGYGIVCRGERLAWRQWLGFGLMLVALLPVALPGRGEALRGRGIFWLLCGGVFLLNGAIGVVTKAHVIHPLAVPERDFLLQAACFQLILALLGLGWRRSRARLRGEAGQLRISWLPVLLVGCYTLCNGTASTFSMAAAKTLDASFQFPVISASVILLTALLAWAAFRERPSRREWLELGLSCAGILLMIGA